MMDAWTDKVTKRRGHYQSRITLRNGREIVVLGNALDTRNLINQFGGVFGSRLVSIVMPSGEVAIVRASEVALIEGLAEDA